MLKALAERMAQVGLELHPDKTRIVYCKDDHRPLTHEHERFDFLGYTFRPRLSKSKDDHHFVNFSPAVSDDAKKAIGKEIRSWRINRRSDKTLGDLAQMFNPIVQRWINRIQREKPPSNARIMPSFPALPWHLSRSNASCQRDPRHNPDLGISRLRALHLTGVVQVGVPPGPAIDLPSVGAHEVSQLAKPLKVVEARCISREPGLELAKDLG